MRLGRARLVMGHCRLAIIGPQDGAQPIRADGDALVVNGEIYNHSDLRAILGESAITAISLGWPWYLGLAVAAALFSWQLVTIRARERDACFRAFMNNNWVGFALFLGVFLHYIVAGAYSS